MSRFCRGWKGGKCCLLWQWEMVDHAHTGVHNLQQFPAAVCTKLEAVFKGLGWKSNPDSHPGKLPVCPHQHNLFISTGKWYLKRNGSKCKWRITMNNFYSFFVLPRPKIHVYLSLKVNRIIQIHHPVDFWQSFCENCLILFCYKATTFLPVRDCVLLQEQELTEWQFLLVFSLWLKRLCSWSSRCVDNKHGRFSDFSLLRSRRVYDYLQPSAAA